MSTTLPRVSPDLTRTLYRDMYRIRRVEEEVARVYPTDKIQSPVHLSIGQEAAAVGTCAALQPQDIVYGTYRSHAMYLAKGGNLRKMIAELYGKATGCAKGKGGSMHMIDVQAGVMGTSAVVATTIPHAVGHALAAKVKGEDRVTVGFFGDGATEEGAFHESLNFAALRQLPVIFLCENNMYAIHTPLEARHSRTGALCERAASYGIKADRVADGDVFAIYDKVKRAADALRAGEPGPYFLECVIYRWKEHVGPNDDFHFGYRSHDEAKPWKESDQVSRLAAMIPADERAAMEREIETEIADAFQFAEESPVPEVSELYSDME